MIVPKKMLCCLLAIGLLSSCNQKTQKPTEKPTESESISVLDTIKDYVDYPEFRLSSIVDGVTTNQPTGYKMKVPYSDTYQIKFINNVKNIKIYDYIGNLICESEKDFTTKKLDKGETIYMVIEPIKQNDIVETEVMATNNQSVLPYESIFETDPKTLAVTGDDDISPLKPAEISYKKREGGTYINSNNPEKLSTNDLNKALCRNQLEGDVFFTFEHNNMSTPFYYGYQVRNTTNRNLYITIQNIGVQFDGPGTWLGEDEWIKFYNTKFEFDTSNWTEDQWATFNELYGFGGNYVSANHQPVTIVLPPNEQIYVMGGTTIDSYLNYNAFNTANHLVSNGCSNAAVLFSVNGGKADGAFYVYDDPANLVNNTTHQGYVVSRNGVNYGSQYIGYDTCHGVVEAEATWYFNDMTLATKLPVTYTNYYADQVSQTGTPYSKIESTPHKKTYSYWATHLNPQAGHDVVGTDMTRYITIDSVTKQEIVIDSDHYDGRGQLANIGNWMIDYQDRYNFVNQGTVDRTLTLALVDNGSTAVMIRDANGNVLESKYTMSRVEKFNYNLKGTVESWSYLYEVTVPAHSVLQLTLEYNLLANSSGYMKHCIYLK